MNYIKVVLSHGMRGMQGYVEGCLHNANIEVTRKIGTNPWEGGDVTWIAKGTVQAAVESFKLMNLIEIGELKVEEATEDVQD